MQCPFCLKEIKKNEKEFQNICIDGMSKDNLLEHINDSIDYCPYCGAIAKDLSVFEKSESKKEKFAENVLKNTEYKFILSNTEKPEIEKKLFLLKHIKDNGLYGVDGIQDVNMWLFLYYKETGKEELANQIANEITKDCLREIEFQKQWYNTNEYTDKVISNSLEFILEIIEVYRQTNCFEKAMQYIDILKKYKFRPHEKSCKAKYKLLYKLCKKQNNERTIAPNVKDSYKEIVF